MGGLYVRPALDDFLPGRGEMEAAGDRFDRLFRPLGVGAGAKVSQLGGDAAAACIELSADDQRAADAAADVGVENDAGAAARAEERLGQTGGIGVVGHGGGQPQRLAAPLPQIKILPAGNLVALDGPPGGRIDRPAEADADRPDAVPGDQLRGDGLDLPPHARGAVANQDVAAPQFDQRRAVAASDAQLQFRGADFNAEKQGTPSIPSPPPPC